MTRSTRSLARNLLLPFITIFLCIGSAKEASCETSPEYQLKAIFLYNFTKFISWPVTRAATESRPIQLCIHGDNPFGSSLNEAVKGRSVRGRSFEVREVGLDDSSICNLLFISSSERHHLREVFERLANTKTLTVGDVPGFLEAGGGIELAVADERVTFLVNLTPMIQSRLSVDARLLDLATKVLGNPEAQK